MTALAAAFSAMALGLLTSLYPCTMATNLTALSWLASSGHNVRRTMIAGLLYALGRVFTYTSLGILLAWASLSHVRVAELLQHYAQQLFGPFLVLTGMFVSDLLFPGAHTISARMLNRFQTRCSHGAPAAFVLGAFLALAFCPAGAALFFGSVVMNVAVGNLSLILLPASFGIGTALPVLVASLLFARGLAVLRARFTTAHWFTRRLPSISGGLLILAGIYLSVRDILLASLTS